jgi:pimeloyl-ACP methyl ester carboxylesterase
MNAHSRRVLRAALAVAGASALVAGVATAATASPSYTKPVPKPTIVLEHGAWEDGSSWAGVTAQLQADGYTVAAPANPLRGLASDSAALSSYLQQATTGPVVLVGHSYGGSVITDAGLSSSEVKALVYVDAFMPDQGESVGSIVGGSTSALNVADPTSVYNIVGNTDGSADVYLKPTTLQQDVAQTLPLRAQNLLVAGQRPIALSAVTDASGVPAWKTIPSWVVAGTQDKVLPLATQLSMAKRAGSHVTQISAPHLSQVTDPIAVARVIEQAANAVS